MKPVNSLTSKPPLPHDNEKMYVPNQSQATPLKPLQDMQPPPSPANSAHKK